MNRAIWVAVGFVLAVALTIVWSLARMSGGSADRSLPEIATSTVSDRVASPLDPQAEVPPTQPHLERTDATSQAGAQDHTEAATVPGKQPAPKIRLHGVLTETSGQRLHPDEILCSRSDRSPGSSCHSFLLFPKRTVPFDAEGNYSVPDLTPGRWRIEAFVPGYQPWESEFRLQEGESDRRLDIALEPRPILHVRVVIQLENSTAQPVSLRDLAGDTDATSSTLQVLVLRDAPFERLGEAMALDVEHGLDRDHAVRQQPGEPGTWVLEESVELETRLPVFVALVVGNQVLQSKQVDSLDEEIVFALTLADVRSRLGGVRFRVLDELGNPSTPPSCQLIREIGQLPESGTGSSAERVQPEFASSNPGEVLLKGLHPGPLEIEIGVPEHARVHLEALVEPGIERDLGDIRLERNLFIRGEVVNPDGSPASTEVWWEGARSEGRTLPMMTGRGSRTDSRGHFVIDDVGRGELVLRAGLEGGRAPTSLPTLVSTESGSMDGVRIQLLETSVVTFKIDKSPHSFILIRVEDSQGLCVASIPAFVHGSGVYAGFSVPRGTFTARAISKGQSFAAADFVVGAEPLRVVLTPP